MSDRHRVAIPSNKKNEIITILKSFNYGPRNWTADHVEDEITTWLKQTTSNEYHWLFEAGDLYISFLFLEDATAFKLRWL